MSKKYKIERAYGYLEAKKLAQRGYAMIHVWVSKDGPGVQEVFYMQKEIEE